MACHNPLFATRAPDDEITIRKSQSSATWEDGEYLELACGRCPSCRSARVRSWAIRAHHESLMHTRFHRGVKIPNGCFLTLTYDDDHLPNDGSLNMRHWQLFVKRLRKRYPFRFLACGEYGPKTHRPHYHALLFGLDFSHDRWRIATADPSKVEFRSPLLDETWGKGFTTLSPLTFATASYVAGYVSKKLTENQRDQLSAHQSSGHMTLDDLLPEFLVQSRRPGLGAKWFEKYWHDVYSKDEVHIGENTYRPPKYYDELLRLKDPAVHHEIMTARAEHLETQGATCENELLARKLNHKAKDGQKAARKDL